MRAIAIAAAVTALPPMTYAGGLDRNGQPIDILFQDGNYAEISLGYTDPSADGTDLITGRGTGNVADGFESLSAGFKIQSTDQLSFAVIVDEPYGADIEYPGAPNATALGRTRAQVDSTALTVLARYEFNENWSVHGGFRYQTLSPEIAFSGLAFRGLSGYNADFGTDGAFGYVIGGAYERPEIALRVALTYSSSITHDLDTVETGVPFLGTVRDVTKVETPASINLDFQTGVAANTLIFGSVRYVPHSDVIVSPTGFDTVVGPTTSNDSVTSLDDSFTIEFGVGRRFNEKWSGRVAIGHDTRGEDDLVSPLAPRNGETYLSVGASYQATDQITLSGGIRYTVIGDSFPEVGTPDTAVADFRDNSALSVGFRIGYKF